MTKYNEGDVLEITEDFELEYADFSNGEKYSVIEVDRSFYTLESGKYAYINTISKVDTHSGFRKVEPKVEHMELGKTYQSTSNYFFYTPTEINFETERVAFDFTSVEGEFESKSTRPFCTIEDEFGVLPPVKPESEVDKALEELKEKLKPENTLAVDITEIETIPVDALREALDFLGFQEVFDTENIISLAKRLS